mmetsp:Transcript_41622/g.120537  ORF Transcript_41622/g.120537 Transcript_41622/m.120537 type:complete len:268 (-) Transcript_41622:197-1000(-)
MVGLPVPRVSKSVCVDALIAKVSVLGPRPLDPPQHAGDSALLAQSGQHRVFPNPHCRRVEEPHQAVGPPDLLPHRAALASEVQQLDQPGGPSGACPAGERDVLVGCVEDPVFDKLVDTHTHHGLEVDGVLQMSIPAVLIVRHRVCVQPLNVLHSPDQSPIRGPEEEDAVVEVPVVEVVRGQHIGLAQAVEAIGLPEEPWHRVFEEEDVYIQPHDIDTESQEERQHEELGIVVNVIRTCRLAEDVGRDAHAEQTPPLRGSSRHLAARM